MNSIVDRFDRLVLAQEAAALAQQESAKAVRDLAWYREQEHYRRARQEGSSGKGPKDFAGVDKEWLSWSFTVETQDGQAVPLQGNVLRQRVCFQNQTVLAVRPGEASGVDCSHGVSRSA